MQATLSFNLDDPDDKLSHYRCIKSLDLAFVIWEMATNSRKKILSKIEYANDKENLTTEDAIEMVLMYFIDLMNEYDITPDSIII